MGKPACPKGNDERILVRRHWPWLRIGMKMDIEN
jgi:hypothetical protein